MNQDAMKHYKLVVNIDANSVQDYSKVKDLAQQILDSKTEGCLWIDSVQIVDKEKEQMEQSLK